jgi:nitrite reductase/ring-hydroxylating ferredoxin subunit
LALFLIEGQVYCVDDICSHEEARISNGGFIEGYEAECPVHGSRFDIRTGEVTMPPADEPLRTFPVQVREGTVLVLLPEGN